ncbi:MAG: dihydrofolate reductase [Tannerella sp.]|jgi:dihydrofolate reductase|nr:dihydrofolate reductase [Tannerella sp.]
MTLTIIVAADEQNAIGKGNALLWHLPADLKHFKERTLGHPILMGSRTFFSFPRRPLPGRQNIVLSSQEAARFGEGVCVCPSLEEALRLCADEEEVFVIGGASVYKQALPLADRIDLTRVHHRFPDADTFFPELNPDEWEEEVPLRQERAADEKDKYACTVHVYIKKLSVHLRNF